MSKMSVYFLIHEFLRTWIRAVAYDRGICGLRRAGNGRRYTRLGRRVGGTRTAGKCGAEPVYPSARHFRLKGRSHDFDAIEGGSNECTE